MIGIDRLTEMVRRWPLIQCRTRKTELPDIYLPCLSPPLTSTTSPVPMSPPAPSPALTQVPASSSPAESDETKTCHFIPYTVEALLKLRDSLVIYCLEEMPSLEQWILSAQQNNEGDEQSHSSTSFPSLACQELKSQSLIRYKVEDLLKVEESPLVHVPDGLSTIATWIQTVTYEKKHNIQKGVLKKGTAAATDSSIKSSTKAATPRSTAARRSKSVVSNTGEPSPSKAQKSQAVGTATSSTTTATSSQSTCTTIPESTNTVSAAKSCIDALKRDDAETASEGEMPGSSNPVASLSTAPSSEASNSPRTFSQANMSPGTPLSSTNSSSLGSNGPPVTPKAQKCHCQRCNQDFKSAMHLKIHHEMSADHHICSACNKDMTSWEELLRHYKESGHKIVCQECCHGGGNAFPPDGTAYRSHFKQQNVCMTCNSHHRVRESLEEHYSSSPGCQPQGRTTAAKNATRVATVPSKPNGSPISQTASATKSNGAKPPESDEARVQRLMSQEVERAKLRMLHEKDRKGEAAVRQSTLNPAPQLLPKAEPKSQVQPAVIAQTDSKGQPAPKARTPTKSSAHNSQDSARQGFSTSPLSDYFARTHNYEPGHRHNTPPPRQTTSYRESQRRYEGPPPFGQPNSSKPIPTTPVPKAQHSSGFRASTTPASAPVAINTSEGTGKAPFSEFTEWCPSAANMTVAYQTITLIDPYKKWSLEELRLGDYAQGRKYGSPVQHPAVPPRQSFTTPAQPATPAAPTIPARPIMPTLVTNPAPQPAPARPTTPAVALVNSTSSYCDINCWTCTRQFSLQSAMIQHLEYESCLYGPGQNQLYALVAKYRNSVFFMYEPDRQNALRGRALFNPYPFYCPGCGNNYSTLAGLFMHFEDSVCDFTRHDEPINGLLQSVRARLIGN